MPMISIEGKKCFYQDIGEGFPILMGHSYLWNSDMWEPQLKSLSKEFRCIAVDLWSHGQSDSLRASSYSIEQLAEDHWKLMQQLGIPKFAVVGLSVGGMWGAQLALNHPDAVEALVIMDSFVGSEPETTQKKYFALMDRLEEDLYFSAPLLDLVVPLFFSPKTLTDKPELVANFRNALSRVSKENIPGIVALGRAIFSRKCLLEKLPMIATQTLVVVGNDDIPRPPKEAEEMVRHLPNAELRTIQDAGHISNLEQPEAVSRLLLEFLVSRSCCAPQV